MQTESLFDAPPLARHNDAATAKAAARRMSIASPNLHAQILDLLGQRPHRALTKTEVCERLGVDPRRWPSVASALSQLKKAGWLVWADERDGMNRWMLREADVHVRRGVL